MEQVLRDVGKHWLASEAAASKDAGRLLFAPERGGTYEVFVERPLSEAIISYCVAEVQHFPLLERELFDGLSPGWQLWVLEQSERRLQQCLLPSFNSGSRDNAIAPSGGPPRGGRHVS
jgi:exonuclease 3'-5' domain-containing protein 1